MSFIRPEARAQLMRWRETIAGAGAVALGLWWMAGPGGLLGWTGAAVALGGLALAVAGVQRARFRTGAGGPGIVQVTEGSIAYFGPVSGGAVALTEMRRIALDPGAVPPAWRLSQPGQPDLMIPLNAEGAEALFDVFSALPGLRTGSLIAEVRRASADPSACPVVIWDRARLRLH